MGEIQKHHMGPNLIRTSKLCPCFKENGWGWVDFFVWLWIFATEK